MERDARRGVRSEHESGVPASASSQTPQAPDEAIGDFETGNDPTGGGRWIRRRLRLATLDGADEAAGVVLELPGVARAALEEESSELVIDMEPGVLSDDELTAALGRGGIEAARWIDEPVPANERGRKGRREQVPTSPDEQSELVDEASDESFPASDPPSYWGRARDEEG
jgi:hypothetical protein